MKRKHSRSSAEKKTKSRVKRIKCATLEGFSKTPAGLSSSFLNPAPDDESRAFTVTVTGSSSQELFSDTESEIIPLLSPTTGRETTSSKSIQAAKNWNAFSEFNLLYSTKVVRNDPSILQASETDVICDLRDLAAQASKKAKLRVKKRALSAADTNSRQESSKCDPLVSKTTTLAQRVVVVLAWKMRGRASLLGVENLSAIAGTMSGTDSSDSDVLLHAEPKKTTLKKKAKRACAEEPLVVSHPAESDHEEMADSPSHRRRKHRSKRRSKTGSGDADELPIERPPGDHPNMDSDDAKQTPKGRKYSKMGSDDDRKKTSKKRKSAGQSTTDSDDVKKNPKELKPERRSRTEVADVRETSKKHKAPRRSAGNDRPSATVAAKSEELYTSSDCSPRKSKKAKKPNTSMNISKSLFGSPGHKAEDQGMVDSPRNKRSTPKGTGEPSGKLSGHRGRAQGNSADDSLMHQELISELFSPSRTKEASKHSVDKHQGVESEQERRKTTQARSKKSRWSAAESPAADSRSGGKRAALNSGLRVATEDPSDADLPQTAGSQSSSSGSDAGGAGGGSGHPALERRPRSPAACSSPSKAKKRVFIAAQQPSDAEEEDAEEESSSASRVRFRTPAHFEEEKFVGEQVWAEDLDGPDTQLWLCKFPVDCDVEKLDGQTVVFGGSNVVAMETTSDDLTYVTEVQALPDELLQASSVVLLAPSKATRRLQAVGRFHGHLSLTRRLQLCPVPVQPVAPLNKSRQLPDGLKLRHVPFGSETPVAREGKDDKKKKKKHKRKHDAVEETTGEDLAGTETATEARHSKDGSKKKKKKKKKKKHREE